MKFYVSIPKMLSIVIVLTLISTVYSMDSCDDLDQCPPFEEPKQLPLEDSDNINTTQLTSSGFAAVLEEIKNGRKKLKETQQRVKEKPQDALVQILSNALDSCEDAIRAHNAHEVDDLTRSINDLSQSINGWGTASMVASTRMDFTQQQKQEETDRKVTEIITLVEQQKGVLEQTPSYQTPYQNSAHVLQQELLQQAQETHDLRKSIFDGIAKIARGLSSLVAKENWD